MRYYPLFIDTADQPVLIVGGGETALAKLRLMLKTQAAITVAAEAAVPAIQALAAEGRITLVAPDRVADLATGDPRDGARWRLVYAAQDDDTADDRVVTQARALGLLVNKVDDKANCDFLTPAIVDRDPVVVAIGTEGTAPVLARQIKAAVEALLAPGLGVLARLAGALRDRAEALPPGAPRRRFWAEVFGGSAEQALAAGGEAAAAAAMADSLDQALAAVDHPRPGRVVLVGAGPGDPELLTLKARKALDQADVVVTDRLVGPGILDLARREAIIQEVGKIPGGPSWSQAAINQLLIDHARAGHLVVRLKSGDPLVFGRADEELEALAAAGIDTQIVPGVTSALAAAADARVSLTRRGRNSAFSFITGQDAHGMAEHDWRALARPGAAAALYMGVGAAAFVRGRMMVHGAPADLPVTVVENAGRRERVIVDAALATLPEDLAAAGIRGPAIILLGIARSEAGATARSAAADTGARADGADWAAEVGGPVHRERRAAHA